MNYLPIALLLMTSIAYSASHVRPETESITKVFNECGSGSEYVVPKGSISPPDKMWTQKVLDFVYSGPVEFQLKDYPHSSGETTKTSVSNVEMTSLRGQKEFKIWTGKELDLALVKHSVLREKMMSKKVIERLAKITYKDFDKDVDVYAFTKSQTGVIQLLKKKMKLETLPTGDDCD